MKKKFFLVGTLVVMAMSAMFVACSNKNEVTNDAANGCTCTIRDSSGYQDTDKFSAMDMKEMGATTCGELATAVKAMYMMSDDYSNATVICK